jgi:AIPR protein
LPHLVSYGGQKNFQYFMQSLKDEHAGGFIPDENWYKDFIAKAIIFKTTQEIVKKQKFPAYQAIISDYTVACLAHRFEDVFDLGLVWARQSISTELATMIQGWTAAIDRALRRTAGARMPSEWAKKIECWDSLREIRLETPVSLPPELHARAAAAESPEPENHEQIETPGTGLDIDSLILRIRPLFNRADFFTRDELITKFSEIFGHSAAEEKTQHESEAVIQTAVRRGILQSRDGGFALLARNFSNYEREMLKDQFSACLDGNKWIERNECIPRFARWLGFRRTGPNIEEAARSVINGLIREDRLEKMGSQIRRKP